MQEKTKKMIYEDIERVRAYAKVFGVTMPEVGADGSVKGLPAPYPREVAGVVRGGHRLTELAQQAARTGIPVQNPILGRNTAAETFEQSQDMYAVAEELGITLFHFVHSEATRHIDPLDGAELIEQSRGKGGITPQGERELVQLGGGAKHPMRINATGDSPHLSILNAFIAGFDGTDIGPVIHVHYGGRGIYDYKTKIINGFKALQICAENNIFVQIESHKHLNNIGGTDGAGLAGCLLAEGLAVLAGLPPELGALQMNVAGINLPADLAAMRAFRRVMRSAALIVVPETFQNPPPDLIAEQGHFARMAMAAKLGGANFYRPKAAESVGIPTGKSMGHAIWATQNIFDNMASYTINDPAIDRREEVVLTEAMAILAATLGIKSLPAPEEVTDTFWRRFEPEELIEKIVTAGKQGILDAPRAGGWDLKRAVKTHRDKDGIRRYVPGYGPAEISEEYLDFTSEEVDVPPEPPVTEKAKVVLATLGADAHVVGINQIREAFQQEGFEVIYMRGMNLPETVAEVVAESKARVVGVSNLLGLGISLFPRLDKRLKEIGLRDKVLVIAGGRIAEKEEEHAELETKIRVEGPGFIGVDAFFGPGTDPLEPVAWVREHLKEVISNE